MYAPRLPESKVVKGPHVNSAGDQHIRPAAWCCGVLRRPGNPIVSSSPEIDRLEPEHDGDPWHTRARVAEYPINGSIMRHNDTIHDRH
ncbi:hypothetical protein CONPUDRAFT_135648, partial [Coniophora puteana RWD-64-598 SS2]